MTGDMIYGERLEDARAAMALYDVDIDRARVFDELGGMTAEQLKMGVFASGYYCRQHLAAIEFARRDGLL